MLIYILFISFLIITINLVIQGLGNLFWLRKIATLTRDDSEMRNGAIIKVLLLSMMLFTLIHVLHSLVWAGCYYLIPHTSGQFESFSEAVYFSLVTFTTLGYGDISLTSDWRLLSGLEAINGIMLIGWSTAMMYSLIQNIYRKINSAQ